MQYKLVFGVILSNLEEEVNAAMKLCWEPHGSLVYTPSKYVQPMVREIFEVDLEGDPMWTTTRAVAAEEDRKIEKELMG